MSGEDYNGKIHFVNGPDELNVESGGVIDFKSGGALKIAGTQVTPSAAELNILDGALVTAGELNAAADQTAQSADGIHPLQVAVATFDPTGDAAMRTVAAHGLGVTLPANALVVGGFMDVNTAFTSTNSTATVAISVESANDIQTAAAVSGAPFSTINRKAIVPKANTPESTSVKTTQAREITATVAVEALLGGKVTIYLYFICGKASA